MVDKYEGFVNLKPRPEAYDGMIWMAKAMMMYQIGAITTLLGEKKFPAGAKLGRDEDVLFATYLIMSHMAIAQINRTNVSF